MSLPLPEIFDVPLFPLPNVILFPGMVLPLHIYEPRYRLLLDDVNKGSKLIAMGHLRSCYETPKDVLPPVYEIAGIGRIAAHQKLDDGTSNVALIGVSRCRIQTELQREPYRIATVQKLQDQPLKNALEKEKSKELHQDLIHITETLMRRALQPDVIKVLKIALKERKELGPLSDFLTSVFVQDPATRQTFLEMSNSLRRAVKLQTLLEGVTNTLDPQPPPFTGKLDDISPN